MAGVRRSGSPRESSKVRKFPERDARERDWDAVCAVCYSRCRKGVTARRSKREAVS
jgi:hypothetical protein